jgi:protein-S-isoprenylcysteine O-methyltransferase Ste14
MHVRHSSDMKLKMNLWFGKTVFILGFFVFGYFRDPHVKRSKQIKVVENRKSKFDVSLIILVAVGQILLPFLWLCFDIFSFADYRLHPLALVVGILTLISGLWLFQRSHADLGDNWSVSLEVREKQKIVSNGVYKYIRHPMYSGLFLYGGAQAFLLSNWIIGPAGVVTFAILYSGRIRSEEKMMLEQFDEEYSTYMRATKRLIPKVL